MLELCSIASGSSGNCICVGSDNHHVLIDAGISGKRIENGLNEVDLKSQDMDGILVTHEHLDHIAGLGVMARRYGLPMYATAGTIEAIKNTPSVGKIDPELFHEIVPQEDFVIGDLTITPIHISHDAADPVAYRIKKENRTFAVVTDLGNYDDEIVQQCWHFLQQCLDRLSEESLVCWDMHSEMHCFTVVYGGAGYSQMRSLEF